MQGNFVFQYEIMRSIVRSILRLSKYIFSIAVQLIPSRLSRFIPYKSFPKKSQLILVGVGPGDSSLMTLAAVDAIKKASVVAFPMSKGNGRGMAETIAAKLITKRKKIMPLFLPMITELEPLKKAWMKAADLLALEVSKGEQVVFLCQGDVSIFSTASYLLRVLHSRHPDCSVRLIPGVTSFAAAAAEGCWPLAFKHDQLLIISTPDKPAELEKIIESCCLKNHVLVLLKLGHRWTWVKPLLERKNLLEKALFAQRVGWHDQEIKNANLVGIEEKPYFSLLLVRRDWPKFTL